MLFRFHKLLRNLNSALYIQESIIAYFNTHWLFVCEILEESILVTISQ